jgi:ABC-type multidrug transport system fused ATPase/permease subunit
MPLAISRLNLRDEFDLIISDTAGFAKGISYDQSKTKHISYIHTPLRYAWETNEYFSHNIKTKVFNAVFRPAFAYVRRFDYQVAQKPDMLFANSQFIAEKVQRYYGRDSDVLYPPVDTSVFYPDGQTGPAQYYLAAGRMLHYKRFDLIIETFKTLGLPLVVAGAGPKEQELKTLAQGARNITFLPFQKTSEEMRRLYSGAKAVIFSQAARGVITPGVAVTLMLLAYQIRIPIFSISFLVDNTQKAIADSKDYFAVMDETPDASDTRGARRLTISKGAISFSDVSFGYDADAPVLNNLSFAVAPDSKVALVGESGEGKTTITSLLLRLYRPDSGVIAIDGTDISRVTQQSLREQIGVVFQDPSLFSGTIYENIAYANPKATREQVEAASKAANAHEFIEKFDKGYDSEIGERGLKLSGGQKQRIAIARALLKDAPILILDEATSSLDNKSELLVQEALERLMKNRTTIIIAHRLSTIRNVDQIVTLKNGRIDEIGTPRRLARSGGIYARLLNLSRQTSAEHVKKTLQEFDLKA